MAGFISVSAPGETVIRRLGPGDEEVVRRLATREPQTALLGDDRTPDNDAANALYASLGGTRVDSVMWDF